VFGENALQSLPRCLLILSLLIIQNTVSRLKQKTIKIHDLYINYN
jgi:hypothetical protein